MLGTKPLPDTADKNGRISLKWRTLLLLSLAELLGMAVWFSATAVIPALTTVWGLSDTGKAWLTMSVQIGFVVGALGSAIFNLADRVPARRMFTLSALLAALTTAAIPALVNGLGLAVMLRFMTGVFLAGVYPVGMKIMATWTRKHRGLAIGMLVGALTIGSASPHLLNAIGGVGDWKPVLYLAAASAALGGLITFTFVREGPYSSASPPFNWKFAGRILAQREIFLSNLGYLGHMWELYAMWAWIPLFLLESFKLSEVNPTWASLASFLVIGIGGVGSLVAGRLADKMGRTRIITASLLVSGASALTVGFLFGGNPVWLFVVSLIWGFAIVADSAQFSTCVSELCQVDYTGTALTLQTCLGFTLTLFTIWMIPPLVNLVGWEWAFAFLAIGPAVGIWATRALSRLPAAANLAGGRG